MKRQSQIDGDKDQIHFFKKLRQQLDSTAPQPSKILGSIDNKSDHFEVRTSSRSEVYLSEK
jgi:hypothetical protein